MLDVAHDVGGALACMHERGYAHNDMKVPAVVIVVNVAAAIPHSAMRAHVVLSRWRMW